MTTTTYLELDDQATGANNNTWGDVADANMAILEQAIARYVAIATTGGTTTLTSSQNRYPIIRLTGTLTSNATIEVKTQEKNWIFINATTGSYTVTVKTSAGTGKTIPRGRAVKLYCDGTNVEYARDRGIPAAQAAGTVDAITATFEPPTTSAELQDGTLFLVEAAGANTSTTPTFNPDTTGALTITKNGGQALAAGDIRAAGHKLLLCYDASSTRYELLNPSTAGVAVTSVSNTFTASQIISVTDNTNAALRITQLGTGEALRVEDSANPDSTPFIIDAAGNVGIGMTPIYAFDLSGGFRKYDATGVAYNVVTIENQGACQVQIGVNGGLQGELRTTGAYPIFLITNNTERLKIDGSNGTLTSQPTYDNTGTGSTVVVSSGGLVRRTSSSIKYKKDVETLDPAISDNAIANLRPIWYRTKNAEGDDKAEWSHIGLIAEEVDLVEKRLVRYRTVNVTTDENGQRVETPLETPEPEDVDYARLSVLLLDKVQRLEARLAQLEAR